MNIVQVIGKRRLKMIVTRKKFIAAVCMMVMLTGAFILTYQYIQKNKAIAVFNDSSEKYTELLDEALPDGRNSKVNIKEFINKIMGFDTEDGSSIIKNSSAIFEETEQEVVETVDVTPEPIIEKDILPTFSQICNSTGISINNATGYNVSPDIACGEPLYINPDENGPQVLIVHTHTTECYDGDNLVGASDRTTDESKNMIEIGRVIKNVLEENGIKCIHDTTVHDYPSYQGAYTREMATIEKNLSEYPSIKIVLDVHRDAFIYQDGSKLKVECDINEESTAKVMIVCGTDAMGLTHPKWYENFKLASKIQNAAQIMYPGMMRPLNLRRERFNMHLTTGSLILEIGANGNTLSQAKSAGEKIAKAIAAVIIKQE